MVRAAKFGEQVQFTTNCTACGNPIGLGTALGGEVIYVDESDRGSCPDPQQDNMPFPHDPADGVFVQDLINCVQAEEEAGD